MLYVVSAEEVDTWLEALPDRHRTWLTASGFAAAPGDLRLLPGEDGAVEAAVLGLGNADAQARSRFTVAQAAPKLPDGAWSIEASFDAEAWDEAALAWLLSGYGYTAKSKPHAPHSATLVPPAGVDTDRITAIATGEALTRDLINTPANLMGPAELAVAAQTLADDHGASCQVTVGEALLDQNFPLIRTVGHASPRAPRLIEMNWGDNGPTLTLVGKGVCFDTGGLNLKPGGSMGLMKKDMGGSATVLGLAHMVMALKLPLRLRVLIPAVENALGGAAFRPGDILTSRTGHTVEINNTDAEGRLVLADALALGGEAEPDLMVSMATLTGAARVAVGPDLAPFFSDDDDFTHALYPAGARVRDPVWQLPFHAPYEAMIEPGTADLDNAPKGGFAGSITAALFLRRFAGGAKSYAHFDIYGWQPSAAPARPMGGVGQGARALLEALPDILGFDR
ncbi:MAG: leucyl aminopeptidase family protein [Pseudomonadota bacterium]